MTDILSRIGDGIMFVLVPTVWPLAARRAWVLMLPVTAPVWAGLWILFVVGTAAVGMAYCSAALFLWAMTPIVHVVVGIHRLWSRP